MALLERGLPRVGLALLASTAGCEAITTEVSIGFLFPDDMTPLAATDNVSLTFEPDGFTETFSADGPDFAVEVELEPDDTSRSLSVYMAQGETLLGYGVTPPFSYRAAVGVDLSVFITYPGAMTTYPAAFDVPDDSTLGAPSRGRGMVVLGGDGGGLFVDAYTYRSIPIAPLSSSRGLPDPRDGTLVGDAEGRVHRVMWEEGLTGFSYDVLVDQWSTMVLDGAVAAGVRSGATSLLDPAAQRLYVFGGGGRLDVVGIDLMGSDQSVSPVDGWTMDAPRPGAQTAWVQIGERGPEPIVFGSDQDTLAPLWFPARGIALGPAGRWIGARCIQVDPPTVDPARVLCAGGLRSDAPTPDALLVVLGSTIVGAAPSVEERPAFLPAALSDPRWLEDDRAVYAQGDARFVRVFRDTLAVDEPPSVTSRARGGQTVRFATAVTFLVGGVDAQDRPLGQWQVFTPDLR